MRKTLKKWLLLLLTALQLAVLSCGIPPGTTTPTTTPTSATTSAINTPTTTPIITTPPTATSPATTPPATIPPTTTPPPTVTTDAGMAFEHLDMRLRLEYYQLCTLGIQVHIMTDYHSVPDILGQPFGARDFLGNDRGELNQVDFARYSVVFAFMGDQAVEGPPLTIEKLWREGRTLYVQARLDRDNPRPYRTATWEDYEIPFDAVVISKADLPVSGELAVELLDQDGVTVATNTVVLPPPEALLPLPVAFLPVQLEARPPEPAPLSLLSCRLLLEDDYLWLVLDEDDSKHLIIWPHGCLFQFKQSGEYEVYYEPYAVKWRYGIEVGGRYLFLGCEIDTATAAEYIGQELPPGCGDSCWFVQDIQPVLT